ncbi:MAG TPA: DUF4203 domain-containing protein [Chthoniobacter sp.]
MPHVHTPAFHLHAMPPAAALLVGIVLLFFGRKLFWFFVGATGFVVGAEAGALLFPHQPSWELIAGLILGLLGIIIALALQKVAIGVAGFWAGGYLAVVLFRVLELPSHDLGWVAFLVGGIIGAVLMFVVFDWALIILSAITGAHLLVNSTDLLPVAGGLTFLVCALIGIIVQSRFLVAPRQVEA